MVSKRVCCIVALLLLAAVPAVMAASDTSDYIDVTTLTVNNITGWPDYDYLSLEVAGIVHGDQTGGTPYSTIYGYCQNACDSGAWDWGGITSTDAQAHPFTYGVGLMSYLDFYNLGNSGNYYCGNGPLVTDAGSGNFMMNNPITASRYVWDSLPHSNQVAMLMNTYNGDIDFDGQVNSLDMTTIILNFQAGGGSGAGNWKDGDFDYSGTVDSGDITKAIINFQNPGAPFVTAAPVPEPGTIVLLLTALGAGLFVYSRKRV